MNNCEIKTPPVFSQEIPKWDRNTYADGNAMGAVVEQLFNNTVYNKEELKEKVDTEGGDISETQVSVIDESTETFPVPMSGDKVKGLWGKLKKWQQDCLAKFGNYVLTSMITNQHVNSTSNIPSSALVYLMQQGITQLNSDIANCFTSVSNGKSLLAAAITDRGINMAADAVFATMANGIRTIQPYKQYANENFYPQPWAFTAQDGTSKNPGAIALNVGFIPLMGFCSKKSDWNSIGFARSWDCFTYNSSSGVFIRYKTDGGNTNILLKSDGTIAFPVPWWDGGAPYVVVIVGYQA